LNLNSLLTGHVGQDTDGTKEEGTALNAKDNKVSRDNGKPPKQKKTRKTKSNKDEKDDSATKRERRTAPPPGMPPNIALLQLPPTREVNQNHPSPPRGNSQTRTTTTLDRPVDMAPKPCCHHPNHHIHTM
jgi:hypothetical protein